MRRSMKPIRKVRPAKLRTMKNFRKEVLKKCCGLCVACLAVGVRTRATDPHHWFPRGQGGGDNHENGIPLCRRHHRWAHDNPKSAIIQGLILERGEKNEAAKNLERIIREHAIPR